MKLVRDMIPRLYAAGDLEPKEQSRPGWVFRRTGGQELDLLLRLKLVEELGEVLSAPTAQRRISELYDLRDVIDGFLRASGAWSVHERVHEAKLDRLGAFAEGWVLEEEVVAALDPDCHHAFATEGSVTRCQLCEGVK